MASFFSRFTLSRKVSLPPNSPDPKKQSSSTKWHGSWSSFFAGINADSSVNKENLVNCVEAANYPFYDPELHEASPSRSPSKRSSWSSLRSKMPLSPSKRNTLHDIAEGIRSKAKIFYKEKEQRSFTPPLMQDLAPPASTPKSVKSRKSVRFRSSNTLCDSRDSSPIKIPVEKPYLPEVDVSGNPFLDSDMELVPKTGRPTETSILATIAELDSTVSPKCVVDPFEDEESLEALPTPMPGSNLTLEDPFNDTEAVTEEIERAASAIAFLLDYGKGKAVLNIDKQSISDLVLDAEHPASAGKDVVENEDVNGILHFQDGYACDAHTSSAAEILLQSENEKEAPEKYDVSEEHGLSAQTTSGDVLDEDLSTFRTSHVADDQSFLEDAPPPETKLHENVQSRRENLVSTEADATFITADSRNSSLSYTVGGNSSLTLATVRSTSGANDNSDPEKRSYHTNIGVDDAHAALPESERNLLAEPVKHNVLRYSIPLKRSPARSGLLSLRNPSDLKLMSNVSSQSPPRKAPAFKCSEFSDDEPITETEYSWHSREAGRTPSPAAVPLPMTIVKSTMQ